MSSVVAVRIRKMWLFSISIDMEVSKKKSSSVRMGCARDDCCFHEVLDDSFTLFLGALSFRHSTSDYHREWSHVFSSFDISAPDECLESILFTNKAQRQSVRWLDMDTMITRTFDDKHAEAGQNVLK
jgi:hypothetical protein